jgi:prepilin-type N-terminal cleavage/methylation domain-containing protein
MTRREDMKPWGPLPCRRAHPPRRAFSARRRSAFLHKLRGFTLIEILAAGVVLAILLVVAARMLSSTVAQHQALMNRRMAIVEADNIMERLFPLPVSELTDQRIREVQLSQEFRQSLPSANLEIDIRPVADDVPARRIAVTIRWRENLGQPERSVRLVAWK